MIERAILTWATDIASLPMVHGLSYLTAILDIANRKVLPGGSPTHPRAISVSPLWRRHSGSGAIG